MPKSVERQDHTKPRHSKARERVLDAAGRLFYEHGIQAVGVDWISRQADVGKMTLYRHFPSKDDLVAAYLERRDAWWRTYFAQALERTEGSPCDRVAGLFQRLEDWFETDGFFGCAFINADAERIDGPARALVTEHKAAMRALVRNQVAAYGVDDIESVTEQIFLLMEGAIVTARLTRSSAPARTAGAAALTLLEANHGSGD